MKQIVLIFLATFACLSCLAQIEYEKGYFIDNSGNRTSCLVRNQDWQQSPERIRYKKSENADIEDLTIDDIREFGVGNFIKYTRFIIDVDMSNQNTNSLSRERSPRFVKDTIFLKSEVEGKAKLYSYNGNALVRYYYAVDDDEVKPLVHKRYFKTSTLIGYNNAYIQQLKTSLACGDLKKADFERTSYTKRELLKLFKKYHDCQDHERNTFDNNLSRQPFRVSLRGGVHQSKLNVNSSFGNELFKIEPVLGYHAGAQVEYFLNFNKNKWAFITEPMVHALKASQTQRLYAIDIDYFSIELPIGIRHYFYISDKSRLFLNLSLYHLWGTDGDSQIIHSTRGEFDIGSLRSWVLGGGYNFNDRVALEAAYGFRRRLLRGTGGVDSDYQSIYLILGVRLF